MINSRTSFGLVASLLLASLASLTRAQNLTTELVTRDGLGSPIYLTAPDGDARLFLLEQQGRVRAFAGGALSAVPFADLASFVSFGTYTGLRCVLFHPDYANNGQVYFYYDGPAQSGGGVDGVLDRYTVTAANPDAIDSSTRLEVLRIHQNQAFHGGGCMHFGQDGMLYVATGDGQGGGGDPTCNAQNGSLLLGKILRLDVDGGTPYAIPADNPFVGNALVRDEIWHLGLRHPWRWSFDRATGDAYIADVGQSGREEVDFQAAGVGGLNFGWKIKEGTTCFSSSGCPAGTPGCASAGLTDPIHEYPTGANCSITGGYVYRGAAMPALQGTYFFGDYCSGRVWSFRYVGGSLTQFQERTSELGGPFSNLTSFGQDAAGELYLLRQNGQVRRIVQDCGGVNYCSSAPNSLSSGAVISASGSPSLSLNSFSLNANSAAAGQFGLFFYGPAQQQTAFGDGFLCVAGGFFRLNPPSPTNVFGDVSRQLDFSSPPASGGAGQILPGSSWNFQHWFRDPAGPGGTGFNTTDGLSVVFCP